MNKEMLLKSISDNVKKKHPKYISQERYLKLFKELPKEFLQERLAYDNLIEKSKQFKLCQLNLSEVKIEVKLTIDELIVFELDLDKWKEDVTFHNIVFSDIKKILK